METLCFENNDNLKNIMGFLKEKMCPQGWIVAWEKMGMGRGCKLGRRCALGKRWACRGDRVGERMWDEEKTFLEEKM